MINNLEINLLPGRHIKPAINLRYERVMQSGFIRYYIASIEQDLFGEWVLLCFWGRKAAKLGNKKCMAYGELDILLNEIVKIHKIRLRHHYLLTSFTVNCKNIAI